MDWVERVNPSLEPAAAALRVFDGCGRFAVPRLLGVPQRLRLSSALGVTMRARLSIAVFLMIPLIARANPVMINGQSLIAFAILAFWALVIESGIATLALISSGVLVVPSFGTLTIANVDPEPGQSTGRRERPVLTFWTSMARRL